MFIRLPQIKVFPYCFTYEIIEMLKNTKFSFSFEAPTMHRFWWLHISWSQEEIGCSSWSAIWPVFQNDQQQNVAWLTNRSDISPRPLQNQPFGKFHRIIVIKVQIDHVEFGRSFKEFKIGLQNIFKPLFLLKTSVFRKLFYKDQKIHLIELSIGCYTLNSNHIIILIRRQTFVFTLLSTMLT